MCIIFNDLISWIGENMLPFYELMKVNYVLILMFALTGGLILIMNGFPKVMNSDDIHTLIPPDISPKMYPEVYKKVNRKDLISRIGISMVITASSSLLSRYHQNPHTDNIYLISARCRSAPQL